MYDYTSEGAYFVTTCTEGHKHLFGKVVNQTMELSQIGQIVREEWLQTAILRPNVELDVYSIMPNHFHGIIFLCRGTSRRAPTRETFGKPTKDSIPTIIRLFKSSVTKRANEMRGTPGLPVWQRNYYEHVVRDGSDLDRIREYILENPTNWKVDEGNPRNIRMDPLHRGARDWSALD